MVGLFVVRSGIELDEADYISFLVLHTKAAGSVPNAQCDEL